MQAPKLEPRIMRYELTDYEWAAIKPFLPNKPRGVPRVNDRRVLNGIFWVLRSGAPWRDLPQELGPYTTCYNRFVRWRRAGVWSRIMDALASAHDARRSLISRPLIGQFGGIFDRRADKRHPILEPGFLWATPAWIANQDCVKSAKDLAAMVARPAHRVRVLELSIFRVWPVCIKRHFQAS
jgi:transposase